jgi:hypothetical protein
MTAGWVLLPVFVQVALTFVLIIWTARARLGALRAGDLKVRDIALGQNAWPARVTQISNCFQNQLELPILFYVLAILVLVTRQADVWFVLLGWAFVALRLLHALVHTTSNHVPTRFNLFAASAIVLMVMWAYFAARLALTAT